MKRVASSKGFHAQLLKLETFNTVVIEYISKIKEP